jgi:retron-type reverse transcriptase
MPQDAPPNGDANDETPVGSWSRVAEMQAKLHRWAAADPGRRFDDLFNFVHDPATLIVAFDRVAGNRGANTAGVDGVTVAMVEEFVGVPGFLDDIRAQLKQGTFRPLPVRERKIPKPGGSGKVRKLGIPTIADRVVQAALKLVLEPIFEADFMPVSYGFRPKRRAHDAIAEIQRFGTKGYQWVLDADIEACFDSISHTALMDRVRARVKDKRVLTLVKSFLKAGVLTETRQHEDSFTGTPQGSLCSAEHKDPYEQRWVMRSAGPFGLVGTGSGGRALRIIPRAWSSRSVSLAGFRFPFEQFVGGLRSSETRLHAGLATKIRSSLCAVLDPRHRAHQARYANAAHNPALFIRRHPLPAAGQYRPVRAR